MLKTPPHVIPMVSLILAQCLLAGSGFVLAMAYRGNLASEASIGGIVAGHVLLLALLVGMTRISLIKRCLAWILGAGYLSALVISAAGRGSSWLQSLQFSVVALVPLSVLTLASFLVGRFYADIVPKCEIAAATSSGRPFQISLAGMLAFTTFVAILLGLGHALHYYVASRSVAFLCVAGLIHGTCGVGSLYLLLWAGMTTGGAFKRYLLVMAASPFLGSVYPTLMKGATYHHYIFWINVYFVCFLIVMTSLVLFRGMGYCVAYSKRRQKAVTGDGESELSREITNDCTRAADRAYCD